ncbi:hypothetical protein TYRP_023308 [Tyrophagus putrescentiae]|nr:hypothetical protein TYRP_023308 [Tyrophagus putrescentiae]
MQQQQQWYTREKGRTTWVGLRPPNKVTIATLNTTVHSATTKYHTVWGAPSALTLVSRIACRRLSLSTENKTPKQALTFFPPKGWLTLTAPSDHVRISTTECIFGPDEQLPAFSGHHRNQRMN